MPIDVLLFFHNYLLSETIQLTLVLTVDGKHLNLTIFTLPKSRVRKLVTNVAFKTKNTRFISFKSAFFSYSIIKSGRFWSSNLPRTEFALDKIPLFSCQHNHFTILSILL